MYQGRGSENKMNEIEKHVIVIDHIHPLKERLISIEKTVEYHERELGEINTTLKELKAGVEISINLAKKTYWLIVGGGIAIAGLWGVIKFALPLLGS